MVLIGVSPYKPQLWHIGTTKNSKKDLIGEHTVSTGIGFQTLQMSEYIYAC